MEGVQFQLDGTNLGSEDTTSPYSFSWNSATATNGSHILTAIAKDAAGNSATSSPVNVTVSGGVSASASLMAGYNFNEGSGTTAGDASGHGNSLTLTGAGWAGASAGKNGNGLSTNGTSGYAAIADNSTLGLGATGTLETWFKPAVLSWQMARPDC